MTPQELKNSILQLAIQGKLVEQRPEEGTAADLYRQIQAEKQMLIKTGKIKKEKSLPEITNDEKPFEIPESWMWVRVSDCISNRAGLAYDKGNLDIHSKNMIRVLRGGNISDMSYSTKPDDVMISAEFVKPELFLRRNMIITPAVTSLDHVGKMGRIEADYDDMVVGGFVLMLSPHIDEDIFSQYLLCAFSSKYFRDCCRSIVNKSGQAFYNLSRGKMMEIVVPLPPLAEQKRIVAKIEELLPLIDRYEQAWTRLEDFNKRFPTDMQKSLLQLAISGKLVEQRPEEGTGEELYQQIQAEKQALIKAGKIKKEKPLPEITKDEIPFEIPESWKWVRLGLLSDITGGYAFKSTDYTSDGIRVVRISDFNENGFVNTKIVRHPFADFLRPFLLEEKNILLCMTGGTVGKSLFVTKLDETMMTNQRVATIKAKHVMPEYVNYNILAPLIQRIILHSKNSTNDNISMDTIKLFPIPLPPLAEQKRIVAKLEELLPLCDKLK